jgi:hypothetical protein
VGGVCSTGTLVVYSLAGCQGASYTAVPGDNNCIVPGPQLTVSGLAKVPQASGGACPPGGTVSVVPYGWQSAARVCGGAKVGGGCDDGKVCVPPPEVGFGEGACIVQAGESKCPEGPYSVGTIVYQGVEDGRACAPCTCAPALGATCPGGVSYLYSDQNCTTQVASFAHDGNCAALGGSLYASSFRYVPPLGGPSGGSCTPSQGQPTGQADPKEPLTVCCTE